MIETLIPGMIASEVIIFLLMAAYYLSLVYQEYRYGQPSTFDYRSSGNCRPCPPLVIPKPVSR